MFLNVQGFISLHITGEKAVNLVRTFEIMLLLQELMKRIKVYLDKTKYDNS